MSTQNFIAVCSTAKVTKMPNQYRTTGVVPTKSEQQVIVQIAMQKDSYETLTKNLRAFNIITAEN